MGQRTAFEVPGIGPIGGWRSAPPGGADAARGALVVVQEIFGVNAHMRAVDERLAGDGWLALAPAMFDPVERDVQLDYDESGFEHGRALVASLGFDRAVAIVSAAAAVLGQEAPGLRCGVVGFCWGGSVAYLANTRLGLPASCWYGRHVVQFLDEPLRAPMQFHVGSRDHSIPAADVEKVRRAMPAAELHVYSAGHGFDREVDPRHFDADAARLARTRTDAFFARTLAHD